jgi:Ca-activated chloride channel family protein
MTVWGLGELTLSGFQNPWWFAFALVPIAVVVLYVLVRLRRTRRLRRFTASDMAASVVRGGDHRWRNVPIILSVAALLLLTVAMAGPTHDTQIPRNRAVIMLAIDVSPSMNATDVAPSRLAAAKQAARQFAQQLTPGVNLGLISFAGHANVLVSPTPQHQATISALDHLQTDNQTAIGEAIFAALQSVQTVAAVLSAGDAPPPPARIVLLSDGKETKPDNPNNPLGAYTAARDAKDQGIPVSTISFGTKTGSVAMDDQQVPVPVDGSMLKQIAELSGGQSYTATNLDELSRSYAAVQQQIGYQHVPGPATGPWLRLAVIAATIAAVAALAINGRLPS